MIKKFPSCSFWEPRFNFPNPHGLSQLWSWKTVARGADLEEVWGQDLSKPWKLCPETSWSRKRALCSEPTCSSTWSLVTPASLGSQVAWWVGYRLNFLSLYKDMFSSTCNSSSRKWSIFSTLSPANDVCSLWEPLSTPQGLYNLSTP